MTNNNNRITHSNTYLVTIIKVSIKSSLKPDSHAVKATVLVVTEDGLTAAFDIPLIVANGNKNNHGIATMQNIQYAAGLTVQLFDDMRPSFNVLRDLIGAQIVADIRIERVRHVEPYSGVSSNRDKAFLDAVLTKDWEPAAIAARNLTNTIVYA